MVQGCLPDAQSFGDVVEGGRVVTALAEGDERRVQDFRAPAGPLLAVVW